MSDSLKNFEVFSEISEEFKQNIKLFHIFDDEKGKNVLFVTYDDKVFAFGSNYCGQCGFGHEEEVETPQEIPELNGKQIKQFFIGDSFVLALNENNHVFGWGQNKYCQLATIYSCEDEYLKPVLIPDLENINKISCGTGYSLALDKQGNVFSWGYNRFGQVGCGERDLSISRPVQLMSLPKIKSINCFEFRSFALTVNGLVYSWGQNSGHCLGHNSRDNIYKPELIYELNNVISIGCTQNYNQTKSYFLTKEGNIYFCGKKEDSEYGQLMYQIIPERLDTELKFQLMLTIRSRGFISLVSSNKNVFHLDFSSLEETKFKEFSDYCSEKEKITAKTIERDRIKLGSGGFGVVYKSVDRYNRREYALKIREINEDEDIEEIKSSIDKLLLCSEEFVVKYYEYWLEDNLFYIKMELCSTNLSKVIDEKEQIFGNMPGQISLNEYFFCSHIFKEILECVQYLHESNPPIIHRNIKPENVLVNTKPLGKRFIKITDSELACSASENPISRSFIENRTQFMAPELNPANYENFERSKFNIKADIYSLGHILLNLVGREKINQINKNEYLKHLEPDTIFDEMTLFRSIKRPTCAEILERSKSWLLVESSVINIEIPKINDEIFIKIYLIHKLASANTNQTINRSYSSNRFELMRELGVGSFGHVFEARSKENQEIYAIKIIEMKSNDKHVSSYASEVEILLEYSEEFVVKYFGAWQENNMFFIQMELCSDNLKNIIKQKTKYFNRNLSDYQIITSTEFFIFSRIFREILYCINHLHYFKTDQSIIHRDLKPANILVNFKPTNGKFIKIADFGTAYESRNGTFSQTDSVGTMKYMPPETFYEKSKYSVKTDIFSLGVILCILLEFDLNDYNQDIKSNKDLKKQWEQVDELIGRMLSYWYILRPTSKEILDNYNFWMIDKNIVNLDLVRSHENPFLYNFLEYHLNNDS